MGIRQWHTHLAKESRGQPLRIPLLLLSNWLVQGLPEMDRSEAALKVLSTLFPSAVVGVILGQFTGLLQATLIGFVLVHTLNWILNDHLLVTLKNFGWIVTSTDRIESELRRLLVRASKSSGISEVYLLGSVSKGLTHAHSDLDIRLVRQTGFRNALKAYYFAMLERARSVLVGFPLDLYVVDSVEAFSRTKQEEIRKLVP